MQWMNEKHICYNKTEWYNTTLNTIYEYDTGLCPCVEKVICTIF